MKKTVSLLLITVLILNLFSLLTVNASEVNNAQNGSNNIFEYGDGTKENPLVMLPWGNLPVQ